jgi:hypothetical protein
MKRHSTDATSLVFGVIFVGVAGWWLAGRYVKVDVDIPHLGWFAAAALIMIGLLGVAGSLRSERRDTERSEPPSTERSEPRDTEPSWPRADLDAAATEEDPSQRA